MSLSRLPSRNNNLPRILLAVIVVLVLVLAFTSPSSASTITVTNTLDDGPGSLRVAIEEANTNPGPDTIEFNIPPSDPNCIAGVCTIQPDTDLPQLTDDGTTIDGYTQGTASPASGSTPASLKIVIDGTNTIARGLEIRSSNNVITGLVIRGFTFYAIDIHRYITGASGNIISGNHIGTDAAGTAAAGNAAGIALRLGAWGNTIGGDTDAARNVISGNTVDGIYISGSTYATHDNIIKGNWIGVSATGSAALPNGGNGLQLVNGAYSNVIGPNNVISGNAQSGILIWGSGTDGNGIKGNFIGTDFTGTSAIPNATVGGGIDINTGAQGNVIGGDTADERNIISGNSGYGISIIGSGTDSTIISANYIGLNVTGTSKLLNGNFGIRVGLGAADTLIGGATIGEGNVITANFAAIKLDTNSHHTTVTANLLGTDSTGLVAMGGGRGVWIDNGSHDNMIGGLTLYERNLISGNGGDGIKISGSGSDNNLVLRNYIGVDISGIGPLPNGYPSCTGCNGVSIEDGAQSNTVGPSNIIAHHPADGIEIDGEFTDYNVVTENSIYANTNLNISLSLDGANEGITPPAISSVNLSPLSVTGSTSPPCTGCTIEVFTSPFSSPLEGKTFLGTGTTDAVGNWVVSTPGLHGPYITATLTDVTRGTSRYSGAFFTEITATYLPLIQR